MAGRFSSPVSRRDFLKFLIMASGTTAMAAFLNACQAAGITIPAPFPTLTSTDVPISSSTSTLTQIPSPTNTTTPTVTPDTRIPVVFVKTRDRVAGVQEALRLWGQNPVNGKSVALKANFNSANPPPASTHPDTFRTLVQQLQGMGAKQITLAERSGSANTRDVLTQLGIFDLARALGIDAVVMNDRRDPADWTLLQTPGSHWPGGFYLSNIFLQADAIFQTCCLKSHTWGVVTLSLKNAVGMVARYLNGVNHDFMNELHTGDIGTMAAEINSAFSPALVLLDGVDAFITGGPEQGQKVHGDVILAGMDRVAIDAVAIALLRYLGHKGPASQGPIFEQTQIKRAVELGLGVNGADKIRLVTGDSDSAAYAEQIQGILLGA